MVEEVGLDPALLNPFHSPHQAVSHLSTNHQPARCAAPLGPYEARQHGALPGIEVAIHGLGQGPSAEKIRCMSTQRWTLRSVKK
jgi:hypothetical protein